MSKKEIEMKMDLLSQLKDMLLGRDGDKMKPVSLEIESMDPGEEEELDMPSSMDVMMEEEEEEEEDEIPSKVKSLREFLGR